MGGLGPMSQRRHQIGFEVIYFQHLISTAGTSFICSRKIFFDFRPELINWCVFKVDF